jgi:nitrogen regulatory protein P-II 1
MSPLHFQAELLQLGHQLYLFAGIGKKPRITFLPKVKLEVVVGDSNATKVMELIVSSAKTGKYGDGKVFLLPIESAMRIRTGEQGDAAV